jgi:hypothetical protein
MDLRLRTVATFTYDKLNINALTQGLAVPVLCRNGGRWPAVEHQFAAYESYKLLCMKDSGRHSALLASIVEQGKTDELAQCETVDIFTNAVRTVVGQTPLLKSDKDLYEDVFGSRSRDYLPELFELIQTVDKDQVIPVDDDSYISTIESYLSAQAAQIAPENR